MCSFVAIASNAGDLLNGIAVDGAGNGIKGVKVWHKNRSNYTKTDKKGRFGLSDISAGDTITVEYRKQTYRVPIGTSGGIRIIIVDGNVNSSPDEELVNHGYGWVKRREYNSASNGISGDRLRATGQTTILKALAGLVPGLDVSPNGKVTLRGRTSIMSDDQPLFLVDGNIVASLDMINLGSVERVEVLKDGSIYGSRGANGAILVYTKRGN